MCVFQVVAELISNFVFSVFLGSIYVCLCMFYIYSGVPKVDEQNGVTSLFYQLQSRSKSLLFANNLTLLPANIQRCGHLLVKRPKFVAELTCTDFVHNPQAGFPRYDGWPFSNQ